MRKKNKITKGGQMPNRGLRMVFTSHFILLSFYILRPHTKLVSNLNYE